MSGLSVPQLAFSGDDFLGDDFSGDAISRVMHFSGDDFLGDAFLGVEPLALAPFHSPLWPWLHSILPLPARLVPTAPTTSSDPYFAHKELTCCLLVESHTTRQVLVIP